jgi:phosphatidylglycerophosphatase A
MTKKLNIWTFLGTFFGVGFIPKAPGTFGSLAAYGIYLLLPSICFEPINRLWYLLALAAFSLIAVLISDRSERTLGHDAGAIVVDEVAGYFLSVAFLPKTWLVGLYAFVLFRVFDIAKPFPISRSQRLKGGWGVVIDDLLAGVYAIILLLIINSIYPKFFGI